ncbi:MAG TPA: hypothetical protein VN192_02865 [Flavobacterium sp.]|nr:hypothetical protein [Flavobacterium sp.]
MAHRKTMAGQVNNPVNGNWVHENTLTEWKNAALKQVAIRKEYEKTHKLTAVRVDSKTVILKEVK